MKRKLWLGFTGVTVFFSVTSYAGTMGELRTDCNHGCGLVIGGDIGYGYLSTQEPNILPPSINVAPSGNIFQKQNRDLGYLVGGGYLGYGFSVLAPLLMGVEAGYKYLGRSKYNQFTNIVDPTGNTIVINHIKVNQQAIDFLLTSRIYVSPRISLIAKAGAAYIRSETKDGSQFNFVLSNGKLNTDATILRIKPEVSLGVGYSINNFGINLMYTHIVGADANVTGYARFWSALPEKLPAVYQYNALTAGLSYTFN